jgi:hypothetical protein
MSRSPKAILDQFRDVKMSASLDALGPDQRHALPPLLQAARAMDQAYMRQMGPGIVELANRLQNEQTPEAKAFRLFKGPYDKLDDDKAFVAGVPQALPGRSLYPEDLTADELEAWIARHPADKDKLLDPYTVVRRSGEKLETIPYSQAFSSELAPAIKGLEAAAKVIGHPGLAAFLEGRVAALAGRKPMRDSDAEWVRLKLPPLEVVIGPYEVYQDHLRGVKAFFEGMLLAVLPDECARVTMIEQGLGALAAAIPCPEGSRQAVGGMAPLLVADELIATGDGASGIHSVAFNLPNDPWVRGNVGWKQIMIRNMMQAKFEHCARPIAERVLARDQLASLSFDAFFYFVVLHEVTHGLGPAYRADGRSVNEACGTVYSTLEDAKATPAGWCCCFRRAASTGSLRSRPSASGSPIWPGSTVPRASGWARRTARRT